MPPVVTISNNQIYIPSETVREEIPIDIDEIESAELYLDEREPVEKLGIRLTEQESNPQKRYAVQQKTTSTLLIEPIELVDVIKKDRVEGRYRCSWDEREEMLTVDLTDLHKPLVND